MHLFLLWKGALVFGARVGRYLELSVPSQHWIVANHVQNHFAGAYGGRMGAYRCVWLRYSNNCRLGFDSK